MPVCVHWFGCKAQAMRKQRVEVYLDQETIEQIDEHLSDAGNSRSARIAYCIRSELQREELKNE